MNFKFMIVTSNFKYFRNINIFWKCFSYTILFSVFMIYFLDISCVQLQQRAYLLMWRETLSTQVSGVQRVIRYRQPWHKQIIPGLWGVPV